jgi:hypothetical protein
VDASLRRLKAKKKEEKGSVINTFIHAKSKNYRRKWSRQNDECKNRNASTRKLHCTCKNIRSYKQQDHSQKAGQELMSTVRPFTAFCAVVRDLNLDFTPVKDRLMQPGR